MFMPPGDPLCIGDVSVVNPCAGSYCGRAAREDGGAAETRDVQKRTAYRLYDPDAYSFVPLSHETHGRLAQPAMNHLHRLAEVASRCGKVNRALFVTNALRRLSVALCKGNALVLRAGLQSLASITGRAVVRARTRPPEIFGCHECVSGFADGFVGTTGTQPLFFVNTYRSLNIIL